MCSSANTSHTNGSSNIQLPSPVERQTLMTQLWSLRRVDGGCGRVWRCVEAGRHIGRVAVCVCV